MAEIKKPGDYLQVYLLVVLVAVITSLPWLYFYNQKQYQLSLATSLHKNQSESLEKQFGHQVLLNQELINSLSVSQEARIKAESELAEISARLAQTEEKLSELDNMDWESKYKFALLDNEIMVEQIAEMEFRQEQYNEQMDESYKQLDSIKKYIEEDFIRLEFEYDDLLEEDTLLENKYISETEQLTKEADALRVKLDKKNKELKEQEQLLAKLKEENTYIKNSMEMEKKGIVAAGETVKDILSKDINKQDNTSTNENFRSARLKSLSNAMLNRNSNDRKNILVSVIPNIPDGISGQELTSLVQGMESTDILSVIRSTTSHIIKPLSNEVFNQLTRNMNNQDAALATNLLSGE